MENAFRVCLDTTSVLAFLFLSALGGNPSADILLQKALVCSVFDTLRTRGPPLHR